MARRATIALAILAMLVGLAVQGVAAQEELTTARDDAQQRKVASSLYWGAYVDGWPSDLGAVDRLERAVGKRFAIVAWGSPWWDFQGYVPFQTSYFEGVRLHGSIPLLTWGAWDPCCEHEQPRFQLARIANGEHDAYLVEWARAARVWGHPFFLSLNPEMNGWWWPWSEQVNGNQPGDFVRAWRHVVDIFREQGATNATWVWCVNIVGPLSTPMDTLYPGDEYVDWTCIDGYNWGLENDNNRWLTFSQVFTGSSYNGWFNSYELLQKVAPNKPVMIGEVASVETGGSKADWILDALGPSLLADFPQIKALVWFNWRVGDPVISWRLDSSPEAQRAFAEAIASPVYASNEFRSVSSAPIQPLDVLRAAAE